VMESTLSSHSLDGFQYHSVLGQKNNYKCEIQFLKMIEANLSVITCTVFLDFSTHTNLYKSSCIKID